jgi:RNA polymerase sigma factor (sigma-70 family)
MHGPLTRQYGGDSTDRQLVRAAVDGSRDALDALLRRHQGFIYSIVLRMLWDPREAEDVTQEILIKIVTGLRSFRADSEFRTWAYRIASNHVLNWRRGRAERTVRGFDDFGIKIDELPDLELAGEMVAEPERRVLADETRAACLTGMLLCLDRSQRLTYILGEVFEVSDALGSEILGITRQNFRQRLARSRRQLYEFMRGKCGLVDSANPCRCARKTRGAIRAGIVDPKSLKFVASHVTRIKQDAKERSREFRHLVGAGYAHLFRDQNLKEPPDLVARLRAIVSDQRFRTALDLDSKPS